MSITSLYNKLVSLIGGPGVLPYDAVRNEKGIPRKKNVGILALVFCLSALGLLRRVEYRQIAVDSTAWYWHAMSLAWLLLLGVLALGQ